MLRTFSKAMSLAGLRFGYALAHPAIAREITKAKLRITSIATARGGARGARRADLLEQSTSRVRDARDRLYRGLQGVRGLRAFPSAANFVLIRCEAQPAGEVFRRLVEQYGILVRDVSGGPGLEGCLRVTAGTVEDVDAVVGALTAILSSAP